MVLRALLLLLLSPNSCGGYHTPVLSPLRDHTILPWSLFSPSGVPNLLRDCMTHGARDTSRIHTFDPKLQWI